MSKTPFSNKVAILSELWGMYLNERQEWDNWKIFFEETGALSLPLCYAVHNELARIEEDSSAKDIIDETFALLCDLIQVDRIGNYVDVEQMFSQSPFAASAV
jgi:hypothetical protein